MALWKGWKVALACMAFSPLIIILGAVFGRVSMHKADLQIYGGRGSLSHDIKIWPITFQGSWPSGPSLFSCEKSHFINKNIYLQRVYEFHKT